MVTALRDFTLYGEPVVHGSPLGALWERCDKRLRTLLERNRFVTHSPVARPAVAPRGSTTPRTADGAPSRRGRPRKAV